MVNTIIAFVWNSKQNTIQNYTKQRMNWEATLRARALTPIFIALISESISSIKSMINAIIRSRSYSSSNSNVIRKLMSYPYKGQTRKHSSQTYLNWFPSHNSEIFCSLHQEARKISAENSLHFIHLLNTQTNSNRINWGLDKAALLFRSADQNWFHNRKLRGSS